MKLDPHIHRQKATATHLDIRKDENEEDTPLAKDIQYDQPDLEREHHIYHATKPRKLESIMREGLRTSYAYGHRINSQSDEREPVIFFSKKAIVGFAYKDDLGDDSTITLISLCLELQENGDSIRKDPEWAGLISFDDIPFSFVREVYVRYVPGGDEREILEMCPDFPTEEIPVHYLDHYLEQHPGKPIRSRSTQSERPVSANDLNSDFEGSPQTHLAYNP